MYPHPSGQWAKTILGRTQYFGVWSDPFAALKRFQDEREYLYAGKAVPPAPEGCTLDELVNRYLAAREVDVQGGELSRRQYSDLKRQGAGILEVLGRTRPVATLGPPDWARLRSDLATGVKVAVRGPMGVRNAMIRVRSIMRWGVESLGLPEPVYGTSFRSPSNRTIRQARRARGPLMFEAAEIRAVLEHLGDRNPRLRAGILLGINCGLGNTDCAELLDKHLDLPDGRLDFPRPKTSADRKGVLWPATVEAVRAALATRQAMAASPRGIPTELRDRVLITSHRRPYVSWSPAGRPVDTLAMEFSRAAAAAGVRRRGLGFYTLRRTYRTIADETQDWPAIDLTMGHADEGRGAGSGLAVAMGDRYRQRIGWDRLAAVAEHVREWLWGS